MVSSNTPVRPSTLVMQTWDEKMVPVSVENRNSWSQTLSLFSLALTSRSLHPTTDLHPTLHNSIIQVLCKHTPVQINLTAMQTVPEDENQASAEGILF